MRQYRRGRSGHLPLGILPPITVALEQSGRKEVAVESLWLGSHLLSYHHGDETGSRVSLRCWAGVSIVESTLNIAKTMLATSSCLKSY